MFSSVIIDQQQAVKYMKHFWENIACLKSYLPYSKSSEKFKEINIQKRYLNLVQVTNCFAALKLTESRKSSGDFGLNWYQNDKLYDLLLEVADGELD